MKGIYKTPDAQREIESRYRHFLNQSPVRTQQFHVPTSQGDTFVIASGDEDKPPLILLHGALTNSLIWLADLPTFSRSFRVYAVDVIGEPGLSAPSRPSLHSEAYASWLSDVARGLGIHRFSIAGASLGGWLALDYATRHPKSVERMVLLCPGGVGRQKIGILFKVLLLSPLGAWGRRRLRESVVGPAVRDPGPGAREFWDYFALMQQGVIPRRDRLPVFSDEALSRLHMPVLAIAGGEDVFFDSFEIKRRIETLPKGEVILYPNEGHVLMNQAAIIDEFLARGLVHAASGLRTG